LSRAARTWLIASVLAGLVGGAALVARARASARSLPVVGTIPAMQMRDQRGRVVSDATLRGQTLVVDFIFTSCTTSCPRLTGRMLDVQRAVAAREKDLGRALPIHLVSITLDPEDDTPEVLAAYAARTGADGDRWSFLTGRSDDLDRVVVEGFDVTFQRARDPAGIVAVMHGEWLVLVDGEGALRGYYSANDSERMDAVVRDAVALAGRS
jgi:protein SCO1/2